ncbi:MAG: hypothetical protein IPP48_00485 [Chitinophagaceae bacterium]|nr:hypothetical protein [Chitinophagaceae bacterium]
MSYAASVNAETIQQWVDKKLSPQMIEEDLKSKGLDADSIMSHIKEFRRIRYGKRKFSAFVMMGIGAVMGFISCVLTITNVLPHMFDIFLYGLTTAAALLVFRGLYLLFEG